MSETLLTKCPHCGTTFRLTQAQLQIAGGAVRCGACYQVFHASEHIVKTAVVEEIRQPPPPQPDPIEEAFDIESEDGLDPYDAAEFSMDSPDADLFSEDYRKSFEPESTLDEFGLAETDVSKPKKGTDESWAEDLLKELGDDIEEEDDGLIHDEMDTGKRKSAISSSDNAFSLDDDAPRLAPAKKKKSGDDLSDTFRNLGSFASDDPFAITEIEEEEFEHGDPNDESWAKAMLEELEEEASPKAKPQGLSILLDDDTAPQAASPFAARELARDKREALERAKAQQKQQPKPAKKPVDKEAGKEKACATARPRNFSVCWMNRKHRPVAPRPKQPSLAWPCAIWIIWTTWRMICVIPQWSLPSCSRMLMTSSTSRSRSAPCTLPTKNRKAIPVAPY